MQIVFFSKAFALFTALAMLTVAVATLFYPTGELVLLFGRIIALESLAFGGAIITTLAYPHLFGVSKGEQVLIVSNDPITNALIIRLATALESRKIHQPIKVLMGDGSEMNGMVESYPGIISPARVAVKAEQNIKVI